MRDKEDYCTRHMSSTYFVEKDQIPAVETYTLEQKTADYAN